MKRLRKHIGHRRDLGAATTFGIAACLSVLGVICGIIGSDFNFTTIQDETLELWAIRLEGYYPHVFDFCHYCTVEMSNNIDEKEQY